MRYQTAPLPEGADSRASPREASARAGILVSMSRENVEVFQRIAEAIRHADPDAAVDAIDPEAVIQPRRAATEGAYAAATASAASPLTRSTPSTCSNPPTPIFG